METPHPFTDFFQRRPEAERGMREILGLADDAPMVVTEPPPCTTIAICPHEGGFTVNGMPGLNAAGEPAVHIDDVVIPPELLPRTWSIPPMIAAGA